VEKKNDQELADKLYGEWEADQYRLWSVFPILRQGQSYEDWITGRRELFTQRLRNFPATGASE
jgi:hypothetical protein